MSAGINWLGAHVTRPVRFCIVENEGPPALFQQKLQDKKDSWDGPDWKQNVFAYQSPWGEFSFADPDMRRDLARFCEDNAVDVVCANPTLGLGVAGTGSPDETNQFVEWLVECGLKSTVAFWLLHHENKAGQISGDWGRHPDTKVQLRADGTRPRTKLTWAKTRWATLTTETTPPKECFLDWIIETQSYSVSAVSPVATSDAELTERLDEYLEEHPLATTNDILTNVEGSDKRIRQLLKTSPNYDSIPGPRRAIRWFKAAEENTPNNLGETPQARRSAAEVKNTPFDFGETPPN